jgi:hypothetical protein
MLQVELLTAGSPEVYVHELRVSHDDEVDD